MLCSKTVKPLSGFRRKRVIESADKFRPLQKPVQLVTVRIELKDCRYSLLPVHYFVLREVRLVHEQRRNRDIHDERFDQTRLALAVPPWPTLIRRTELHPAWSPQCLDEIRELLTVRFSYDAKFAAAIFRVNLFVGWSWNR